GQTEVLSDIEVGEDLPALRDIPHAQPEDLVRSLAGDVAALEDDPARSRGRQPHDGAQRRGLARAVPPEQDADPAARHGEGHAAAHVTLPVYGIEPLETTYGMSPERYLATSSEA